MASKRKNRNRIYKMDMDSGSAGIRRIFEFYELDFLAKSSLRKKKRVKK